MRVDLGPLLRPVSTDFLMASGDTALECLRPSHICGHRGEGEGDVSCVGEGGVGRAGATSLMFADVASKRDGLSRW